MFKKLFLVFLSSVFAKIDNPKYDYIFYEQFNSIIEHPKLKVALSPINAWVVSLNRDVEHLKLRRVSRKEAREVFGSNIDDGSRRQPNRVNKKRLEPKTPSTPAPEADKAKLMDIMRLINKFALTTHNEPDAYIGDGADNGIPTLKLYFKGVHTSLVVRAEGRQWHYIIGPSSLFPEWFYEEHEAQVDDSGAFVDVPKDVANQFYTALFKLLTMFLSLPL